MEHITCPNCAAVNTSSAKYCKQCGHSLPKPVVETSDEPVYVSSESRNRRNNIIGAVTGIVVFGIVIFGVTQFFDKQEFLKPQSFDNVMMQVASEINKSCPIMVDSETRLDNVIALPDNVFQYNYTLINYSKEDVNVNDIIKNIEPGIINNVRTNPDMQIYRDNKTTMNYFYKDKNGEFINKISVTPDMYQ